VHEYDIAGHPQSDFHFAVVFPYHPADATVTLIREYAQVGGELEGRAGGGRQAGQQEDWRWAMRLQAQELQEQAWLCREADSCPSRAAGPEPAGVVPAHRRL
jgi:hypothetical protein